jgi:hypothetical protein
MTNRTQNKRVEPAPHLTILQRIAAVTKELRRVRDEVDSIHEALVNSNAKETIERKCTEASTLIHNAALKLSSIPKRTTTAQSHAQLMRLDPSVLLADPNDLPEDAFVAGDDATDA